MNLALLGPAFLRQTLEADPAYAAELAWGSITKTFGEYVPADVAMPYVTIEHYAGGLANTGQSAWSDSLWKVAVHVIQDEDTALRIGNLIYQALHDVWPVVGSITGYAGYHPVELKYPYTDTLIRQGNVLIRSGGIYSLRLAETKG